MLRRQRIVLSPRIKLHNTNERKTRSLHRSKFLLSFSFESPLSPFVYSFLQRSTGARPVFTTRVEHVEILLQNTAKTMNKSSQSLLGEVNMFGFGTCKLQYHSLPTLASPAASRRRPPVFLNTPLARPTDLDELPMQRHRLLLRAQGAGAVGRAAATATAAVHSTGTTGTRLPLRHSHSPRGTGWVR